MTYVVCTGQWLHKYDANTSQILCKYYENTTQTLRKYSTNTKRTKAVITIRQELHTKHMLENFVKKT